MPTWEYYEPGQKPGKDKKEPKPDQSDNILPRTKQELEGKVIQLYRQMTSGPEMLKEEWYMAKGWIDCLHWILKTADLPDAEPVRATKRYLTEK